MLGRLQPRMGASSQPGVEPLVVQLLELPLNPSSKENAAFVGFPKELVVLPN